ncbi:hypothetical protein [Cryobacterium sp. TMT1-2-2]|nr:hypothetical protein [Cryobacterium sp. TMT1-2-2]
MQMTLKPKTEHAWIGAGCESQLTAINHRFRDFRNTISGETEFFRNG